MQSATLIRAFFGAGVALIVATPSFAQTFSGNSSGTFGTPSPGANANPVSTGVGTNTFTFGESFKGSPPNQYSFMGASFSTTIDSSFQIGTFTYYNGTVGLGTTIDTVPLNILVNFTDPTGIDRAFSFNLQNISTPNVGTPEQRADFVYPINKTSDRTFTIGTTNYTLSLNGFSQDGVTIVDELRALENESTTAGVYGKITATPIPEPTSMLGILAFSALGGGALLRRKHQ